MKCSWLGVVTCPDRVSDAGIVTHLIPCQDVRLRHFQILFWALIDTTSHFMSESISSHQTRLFESEEAFAVIRLYLSNHSQWPNCQTEWLGSFVSKLVWGTLLNCCNSPNCDDILVRVHLIFGILWLLYLCLTNFSIEKINKTTKN